MIEESQEVAKSLDSYRNRVLTEKSEMITEMYLLTGLVIEQKPVVVGLKAYLSGPKSPGILEWFDTPDAVEINDYLEGYFRNKGIFPPQYKACVWGVISRISSGKFSSIADEAVCEYLARVVAFKDGEPVYLSCPEKPGTRTIQ